MNQVRLITAEDFADDCPVSLGLAMRLTRAEPDTLLDLLDGIPAAPRARLALWLYGRSHTHEIGVRVAATCERVSLHQAGGPVGDALHELSRRPYTAPSHGMHSGNGRRHVSLGGSRSSSVDASL
ncbi:hypothetical protein [Methylobacterium sp. J-070]|uniref:hypothetical protein n=1 Tax=Methylobacterium sp. J-070 TaxID=2836650 RepID=UPI001FB954C2|nr:hypothetical protein [Methylobacterium sp. J-070]MCJ2048395.1 hypothetical protein [Methylobacterium sp. J-070]